MAQQTAVEFLFEEFFKVKWDDMPNRPTMFEQAKQMEEQRIKDAIMYALDEDGHTGDWKIKFAKDYINNLKQTK